MQLGDLAVLRYDIASFHAGDVCMILSTPRAERVGAWGMQEEVEVLCMGKQARLPVHAINIVNIADTDEVKTL